MAVQRMDHVGIVVDDLRAAIDFFVELGLELEAEWTADGAWVGRVIGLEGVRAACAMLRTPDGHGQLELVKYESPPNEGDDRRAPSNARGLRHITFAVDDIDDVLARLRARGAELIGTVERYEDTYRLCYIRGPEGIIIELGERIG